MKCVKSCATRWLLDKFFVDKEEKRMKWLLIGMAVIILIIAFVLWCCCKVGKQADEKMKDIMKSKM